jgi:hypothetical protein
MFDDGFWVFDVASSFLVLDNDFWVLDDNFHVLDDGFRVLDDSFWVLGDMFRFANFSTTLQNLSGNMQTSYGIKILRKFCPAYMYVLIKLAHTGEKG